MPGIGSCIFGIMKRFVLLTITLSVLLGSLQFYGRTLENCSNCGNLQVHNRFLEDNRDVLLRLNLGGFSPVIVNNVFKTCESKGRDFDCRLVILGARPRSSAAYAVISDQNSLPVDNFNTQSPFIFGQCTAPHSYSQLSDYYASIYSVQNSSHNESNGPQVYHSPSSLTQNSNSEASTNSIVYSDITTAAQLSQNQQSSPMNPSFKPAPRNQVKSSKSDSKIRYFRSKSSPGVCNEISKKNFASEEHNSDNNHSGHFYISVPQISSGSGETSLCFDVQESSPIPVGAKTGTNKEPFQFTNYDVRKRNKRLIEIINQSVANKRYLSSMGRVADTQNDGTMQEEHVMGQLTPQSSVMKHPYSTKLETIQNDQPSGSVHDDEKSVVIEASTTAMVFKSPTESGVSPGKVSLTERNQICVSVASPVPIISSDNRCSEILQIDGGNADELDASNLTKRSDASTREGTADVFSAIVDNKTLNVQITREREQDITKWSNLDVVSFFKGTDCAEYAYIFEQEVN